SKSLPGVRMVTAAGTQGPSAGQSRISSGSSATTASHRRRAVEPRTSRIWTLAAALRTAPVTDTSPPRPAPGPALHGKLQAYSRYGNCAGGGRPTGSPLHPPAAGGPAPGAPAP